MYKLSVKSWIKHFDFTLLDLFTVELAFVLAYVLRFGWSSPFGDTMYSRLGILLPVMHVVTVFFTSAYSGVLRRGYFKEFQASIKHTSFLFGLIFLYMFITKSSEEYSRIFLMVMWFLGGIMIWVSRIILKKILVKIFAQEKNLSYLLVLTTSSDAEKTLQKLQSSLYSNYLIKGVVLLDSSECLDTIGDVPVVGTLSTLFEYVRFNTVDAVFIESMKNHEDINNLTTDLLEAGLTVHISLDGLSAKVPNKVIEQINGCTVLTTSIKLASTRQLFIKRIFDILGGLVGTVAIAFAFIIFAPIIYLQSPGPIFFSQVRVGRNGRKFKIYKFRSMYLDAEERKKELMSLNKINGLMFKMDEDPRIIPIGHFIRKYSIDELPQFINVLKGDMSLVGTRPPTVDEYVQYKIHHKRRLAGKPGLTGMWQISGRSDITDFEEVVRLDSEYISKFSLGLYFKIIFKTIGVVLGKKGSV